MKKSISYILYAIPIALALSCSSNTDYDASGSFEAIERIISAQATGKIKNLNIEEGQTLQRDTIIGQIDVSLLKLKYEQIQASLNALNQKTNDAAPQIRVLKVQLSTQQRNVESLQEQLTTLNKDVNRFQNLVASGAAPQKHLDDVAGQQAVLTKKLEAAQTQSLVIKEKIRSTKRNIHIQNRAILSEKEPTIKRLKLLQQQIDDGTIINEYTGTVISKYAYTGEFTQIGKPLYKIADLSNIILRTYISPDQLAAIKLGDTVMVLTDNNEGGYTKKKGVLTWISDKAEFTPKTIQTKNERANQVYAVKIKIANNGTYKIGMYGEIKFNPDE